MSSKVRKGYFVFFILLFLVLIPVVIFYSLGYNISLDKKFSFFKTGGISIYPSEPGVIVSLNGKEEGRTSIFEHSVLIKSLSPGQYNVSVTKDGYRQWDKTITVLEEKVSEGFPLLLPQNLTPILLSGTSTASSTELTNSYNEAIALFTPPTPVKKIKIPSTETATVTPESLGITNHKVLLYKDDGVIKVRWLGKMEEIPYFFCFLVSEGNTCNASFIAYKAKDLRDISFFPGRNDVVIFSAGNAVSVVELDRRAPEFFMALYKGKMPDFRIGKDDVLYIKDDGLLYKIDLS